MCSGRPCYHSISNNLPGFKECSESITTSQSPNDCQYSCIESLFKDREELFSKLFEFDLGESFDFFRPEYKQFMLCGNCINHFLLSDEFRIFLQLCKDIKVPHDVSSIVWLFSQCLMSPIFRDIVLSDLNLFGFMCIIWFGTVEHCLDNSYHQIEKVFLIRFYLNVSHWTRTNILYFFMCHLKQLTFTINDIMSFCKHYPNKLREYDLVFIVRMRAAFVCQYFRKFKHRTSAKKWADGKQYDIGLRQSLRFDLRAIDKEQRINAKELRRKVSLHLKRNHLECQECNKSAQCLRIKKLKLCSGCKEVYFCGKLCQKKSWNASHRFECKQLKAMKQKWGLMRANDVCTDFLAQIMESKCDELFGCCNKNTFEFFPYL